MNKGSNIWTVSNILTLFRVVLLIPIICAIREEKVLWIAFWAVLAILTDLFDGYLARKMNQQTDFGRILDPVTDKLLVLGVMGFMTFSSKYNFPFWFFLMVIGREIIMLTCAFFVIRKKTIVMESNRAGKNSAFALGVAVLLYAVQFHPYALYTLYLALVLTVYSSILYFRLFLKQVRATDKKD